MEKQMALKRSILYVAAATVSILMIPFLAMQVTDEVNWGVLDFAIVGALVFGIGLSYVLITRYATDIAYKAATAMTLGATLFMIWANLGVGLIGSGPNPGNLMYMGVLVVLIIGMLLSGFKAASMERAMYATGLSLVLHTIIAFATGMHEYPGSSVIEILGVNGFFIALYAISGVLFRLASKEKSSAD